MKSLLNLTSIVTLIALVGCESVPKIDNQINPNVDLSNFKLFALLPLPTSIPGADPGVILKYGQTVHEGVSETLYSKGYIPTAVENADFVVNIKANSVPKVKVTDMGYNYGPSYNAWGYGGRYPYGYGGYNSMAMGMNSGVRVDNYEEGTLIIEIYDAKNKELVWVGWATDRKKKKGIGHGELKMLIRNIMVSFPPQGTVTGNYK